MKLISLRGSHYEIGLNHGKTMAGEIRRLYDLYLRKLAEREISREAAGRITGTLGKYVEEYAPELLEEVKGIADGAGMEFESVLSLNCLFEIPRIAGKKEIHECTVWGFANGKVCIAAQNLDLATEYGEFLTLFRIAPDTQRSMLLLAMPGMISMIGMNRDGLVFSGTTVSSREARYGLPKAFIGRTVLQDCENVTHAAEALHGFPRTTGGNPLLADATGGLSVLECSASKCAVISPEDGCIASTNHYTDAELKRCNPQDTASSEARLRRIQWLLHHARKRDLEEMVSFARDHEHTPNDFTICRHGSISTVSSLIFLPAERNIWIANGLPCRNNFRRYNVLG